MACLASLVELLILQWSRRKASIIPNSPVGPNHHRSSNNRSLLWGKGSNRKYLSSSRKNLIKTSRFALRIKILARYSAILPKMLATLIKKRSHQNQNLFQDQALRSWVSRSPWTYSNYQKYHPLTCFKTKLWETHKSWIRYITVMGRCHPTHKSKKVEEALRVTLIILDLVYAPHKWKAETVWGRCSAWAR